jgi:hypothetical protein
LVIKQHGDGQNPPYADDLDIQKKGIDEFPTIIDDIFDVL